ncbi:hypothetical protein D3C77_768240 [compost metagenome]
MAAAHAPTHDDALEPGRVIFRILHVLDELRHILGRDVEDEVGVAAEHARVQGQGIQAGLVAVRLA